VFIVCLLSFHLSFVPSCCSSTNLHIPYTHLILIDKLIKNILFCNLNSTNCFYVFQRERQNEHYSVIGNTFLSIPFILLVPIIPAAITYYLPGLHKGFEHFLYFASVLFSSLMSVESLMMIAATIVLNYLMEIITGAGIQRIMILIP